jgi:hypothetical protein
MFFSKITIITLMTFSFMQCVKASSYHYFNYKKKERITPDCIGTSTSRSVWSLSLNGFYSVILLP